MVTHSAMLSSKLFALSSGRPSRASFKLPSGRHLLTGGSVVAHVDMGALRRAATLHWYVAGGTSHMGGSCSPRSDVCEGGCLRVETRCLRQRIIKGLAWADEPLVQVRSSRRLAGCSPEAVSQRGGHVAASQLGAAAPPGLEPSRAVACACARATGCASEHVRSD